MNTVWISCEVKHITYHDAGKNEKKALLIYDGSKNSDGSEKNTWVPWKLVDDYSETNGKIDEIEIPEWFANKEGLI